MKVPRFLQIKRVVEIAKLNEMRTKVNAKLLHHRGIVFIPDQKSLRRMRRELIASKNEIA